MMRLLAILCVFLPFGVFAQKEVTISGISFSYEIVGDELMVQLSAPTLGWVGMGFNHKNDIVGSDLYLFHVETGNVEGLDMYVVGAGNPKNDTALSGSYDIMDLKGKEDGGGTQISCRLPFPSNDDRDFQHRTGQKFWLILAYSTHDEFDHHSRVRKHISFVLTE